ncbi:MAG TPA: hypothetical protein VM240_09735 [Verrucomicrobiae bacterium]|nr:hypothetical protein [Verrucomicrobiae bacterium]
MRHIPQPTGITLALFTALLAACGVGGMQSSSAPTGGGVVPATFEGPVAKAVCQDGDLEETALQGQVPQADRESGRTLTGYNCNLERVGHLPGQGAGWQHAWFEDCAYHNQATGNNPAPTNPGVVVVDVSNPAAPARTVSLNTQGMIDPWESLKVNERRQMLAAVDSSNGNGSAAFDVYDIAGDCKQPALLFSGAVGTAIGHAGNWAPDGTTYYGGQLGNAANFKAMDVTDATAPTLIVQGFPIGTHDMSVSTDGNRAYFATTNPNSLQILDVSQINNRTPNPESTIVGSVAWTDGSTAQMTQAVTIKGVPYILFVDEGGKGAARLIDISNEAAPFIASKLKLEVHMPENSQAISADQGSAIFGYQGHYCTASDGINDNHTNTIDNAVIAVCGYFESGLRVFDIREPYSPKEIAYYNPPASPGYKAGADYNLSGGCHTVDWASSHPRYIPARNEIWFTSQCGGFHVVRFEKPLAELLDPAP